jgi:CubicO group peptidase (beta-lactamase class C family)
MDFQLAALLAGVTAVGLCAEPPDTVDFKFDFAARMNALHVPGVSVAIIDGYRIVWAKGYGPGITPETRFQAASISKPVAAMAALKLVEQGKLSLDEDVNAKLKSWKVPGNQFTQQEKVTLRRLLSHSAGLTVHGFAGYDISAPLPTLPQILDGVKPANSAAVRVDIKPGTESRYSGGGLTVMQLLMMDVTGTQFPELMESTVLSKVGMRHSTYLQPLPDAWKKEAAIAHDQNGKPIHGDWHVYPEMAAAGLWTTPSDLAQFAIELQLSKQGKANHVLSREMTNQMLTRQIADVGLGIMLIGHGEAELFEHGGSNEGFKCLLVATMNTGQGVVIMTNGDQGGKLADEVQKAVAAEFHWPTLTPNPPK